MLQHLESEREIDPVGCVGEEEGADRRQSRAENRADDEQSAKHIERAQTLLNDHLVDDHLDDHRIGQSEDLDEERGNDHLDEGPRVLPDVGEERAESELFPLRGTGAPREQDRIALFARFRKLLPIDPFLLIGFILCDRIGDQKPVRRDSLHDDGTLAENHQEGCILITQGLQRKLQRLRGDPYHVGHRSDAVEGKRRSPFSSFKLEIQGRTDHLFPEREIQLAGKHLQASEDCLFGPGCLVEGRGRKRMKDEG